MDFDKPYDSGLIGCQDSNCDSTIKNNSWSKIKVGGEWFFSRDGEQVFCPDHLPDWVPAWRAKQRALKGTPR